MLFLENVKNLASHDNGKTFKVILETLSELGYQVKYKVLNSFEYGNVPQNRERVYIIGFRSEKDYAKFSFPEKMELTTSLSDILSERV